MSGFKVVCNRAAASWSLRDEDGHEVASCNNFLASIAVRGLSFCTMRAYAFDLLHLFNWLRGEARELEGLTANDLLRFIDYERRLGAGPNTINRRLVTARLLYRFTTNKEIDYFDRGHYMGRGRDRQLGINCLPRKRRHLRVKVPAKIMEPLTPAEIGQFMRRMKRYRDISIAQLLLFCGLRSSEVRGLRTGDVDFVDRRLLVRGKGMKERVIPLPAFAMESVQRYLDFERPAIAGEDRLFVILQGRCRGLPITEAGLRSLFRYRRRTKGLTRANPHRFRHTFGADMARAGVRLPVLQKMMGHVNGMTTLQYINLSMADVADAYEAAMRNIEARYSRKENNE